MLGTSKCCHFGKVLQWIIKMDGACTRPGGHEERARSPTTRPPPHAPTKEQSRRHVTHVVDQAARKQEEEIKRKSA